MNATSEGITRETLMLETPYAAPTSKTEEIIANIWSETFGISGLGIDDDFFDLGGDSLIATTITRKVGEALDYPLKAGSLVEANTVRQIGELLNDKFALNLPTHIVPLRSKGERVPLFIVHGAAGFLFPSAAFLGGFHEDQPVYAFQVPGYDGTHEPMDTVEDIADEYLRCMKMVSPDGPWHLAGICNGSWIAFEMALRLRAEGERPETLTIVDPGVQPGKMRADYVRARGENFTGIMAPVASLVSELKIGYKSQLEKYRCYRATGKWVDPSDPNAHDIPEVWDWIQNGQKKQKVKPKRAKQAFKSEKELEIRSTPEANLASSKLKLAFYKYSSETSIDMPANLIASEFLNGKMKNPMHPIRRLMPDLEITVFGKYHSDTVSTETADTSIIMQRIVDAATQS